MIKKLLFIDAANLYGWAMSWSLPYDEINFDTKVDLEYILNTPDESVLGFFLGNDLNHPDEMKETANNFPFCPEKKN